MFSTKELLPLTLKKLGLKGQLAIHSVILHWEDIVGSDIALNSRPTSSKNKVLFVAVKTPVWGHHLAMMKLQLLEKIHGYLGQKLLEDIKFYAGNFQNYTNLIKDEPDFAVKLRNVSLSDSQCMEVKSIAHAVTDDRLRYRLQRLMVKDKKRKHLLLQDGWHTCLTCSALCPPDSKYCTTCFVNNSRRRREEIRCLLADAPWIDYAEANSCFVCTRSEYTRAKQEVVQSLLYKIDLNHPENLEVSALGMLLFRLTPEKINQEVIEKTLRFVRRNRYVLASRR